jgi:hypothetical protein
MDSAEVAERYQRSPRLSRSGRVALGTAGVLALTAVVSWFALRQANPAISSAVLGYQVTSDQTVDVRFQVDKAPGRKAVCILRARNSAGEEVGRRNVAVPADPGGPRATVLSETLHTNDRAIVGEVLQCDLVG